MGQSSQPDMIVIEHRRTIGRPADKVWASVGGFFDLDRYLDVTCEPLSGEGALGSVRLVNGALVEPLVGASRLSYTYAQTVGPMSGHAYHGSVTCEPLPGNACELVYAIVYDQRGIEAERRDAERTRLTARFAGAHLAMVEAAEG